MKGLLKLLPAVLGAGLMFATPAHARNYDCSKAGNANKAACKGGAASPSSAPVAPTPKPAAKPATARNYDCSKAGNANKAVCKGAAASPGPAPKPASTRNYDCSKAGNANKAVCKGAVAPGSASTSAPASAPKKSWWSPKPSASSTAPSAAPARTNAPTNTNPAGPNGATAVCNDGTYSHSAHRSGTCSHHGGVKSWY